MVITEYVPYGDLLGFLRKSRGLQDNYYNDPDIKPQSSLRPKQLFGFAWDIANGMEFLASEKVCMLWDVNDHGVELLAAKKKGESFATSMSWIRAKVSFALLRSSLFFLRVSRVSRRVNLELSDTDLDVEKGLANIRYGHASRTLIYSSFLSEYVYL